MGLIHDIKERLLALRLTKPLTHQDGYIAACDRLLSGECPEKLKGQALSDMEPDEFTKGWLAAIRDSKKESAKNGNAKRDCQPLYMQQFGRADRPNEKNYQPVVELGPLTPGPGKE